MDDENEDEERRGPIGDEIGGTIGTIVSDRMVLRGSLDGYVTVERDKERREERKKKETNADADEER